MTRNSPRLTPATPSTRNQNRYPHVLMTTKDPHCGHWRVFTAYPPPCTNTHIHEGLCHNQWQSNCGTAAEMTALGSTVASSQAQIIQHIANLNAINACKTGAETAANTHDMRPTRLRPLLLQAEALEPLWRQ
jgi:hypothetical protein